MRKILYPAMAVLLFACQQKNGLLTSSKEAELRTFAQENLRKGLPDATLDSFRFIQLDTITQQQKYYASLTGLYDELDALDGKIKEELKEVEESKRSMRLYGSFSKDLFENAKSEGLEHLDSIKAIQKRREILQSKLNHYDSLASKADSVAPVGYEAVCLYQIRKKDQSVEKDTTRLILNQDLNIVKRSDFLKIDF